MDPLATNETGLRLFALLVFLVAYSFGSYLFLREPRKTVNRLFILLLLCPFAEDLLHLLLPPLGIPVAKVPDTAAIFLPVLSYHFVTLMGRGALSLRRVNTLYGLGLALFLAQWGAERPAYSWLFAAIVLVAVAPTVSRAFRRLPSRFERNQFRLIVAGLGLYLAYALGVPIVFAGDPSAIFWRLFAPLLPVVLVGGPIIKLRLSNVWLVFRKGFAYGFALALFVAAAFGLLFWLTTQSPLTVEASPYLVFLILVAFAVLFQPVMEKVRKTIDTTIFPYTYSFADVAERLSRRLAGALLLDDLLKLAAETLAECFKLDRLLVVGGPDPGAARAWPEPGPDFDEVVTLATCNFERLAAFAAGPLHLDELEGEERTGAAAAALGRAGYTLALAVPNEAGPAWLVLLGPKGGSSDYNNEDLQLVATVGSQLSISLQRAGAFRTLAETNRKLEETIETLRLTQRELARQERLAVIGKMAATIAHEVRNPLGIMKLSARTLGDRFADGSEERKLSDFINSEVDKLNHVVTDLLDFTREPVVTFRRERIRDMVDAAATRAGLYARGQIHIEVDEAGEPVAAVYRNGLERVFTNLLMNAVEAMSAAGAPKEPGTGVIRVRIRPDGSCGRHMPGTPQDLASAATDGYGVRIEIEDEGPGIDPKDAENVFEPFFTTREGGTGLGLAVCAKIVLAHGGAIRVDPAYRSGCRMVVTLPDDPAAGKEPAAKKEGTA